MKSMIFVINGLVPRSKVITGYFCAILQVHVMVIIMTLLGVLTVPKVGWEANVKFLVLMENR